MQQQRYTQAQEAWQGKFLEANLPYYPTGKKVACLLKGHKTNCVGEMRDIRHNIQNEQENTKSEWRKG